MLKQERNFPGHFWCFVEGWKHPAGISRDSKSGQKGYQRDRIFGTSVARDGVGACARGDEEALPAVRPSPPQQRAQTGFFLQSSGGRSKQAG